MSVVWTLAGDGEGKLKQAALRLYDDGTAQLPLGDDLKAQLERMPDEMRVWLDIQLGRGVAFEELHDWAVERRRLAAVPPAELRCEWTSRARGVRRAWYRPAHRDERGWRLLPGSNKHFWVFIGYEPRLEKELRVGRSKSKPQESHWPTRLAP